MLGLGSESIQAVESQYWFMNVSGNIDSLENALLSSG